MISLLDPTEILVVVPTLNEEAYIEACLRSLIGTDPEMRRVRVVVADGGSVDLTRDVVARLAASDFPNLVLVDNPARYQSAGINRAVEEAAAPEHRILVRCDAHSIYPPGYVLDVAGRLRDLDVASLVVPMDAGGEGAFGRAAARIVDTPLGSGGSAHRGGMRSGFVDHGHHAAFALDWFRKIGGYDPSFTHNEDAEYDTRLTRAGGKIWLAADIRVAYKMRGTFGKLAKQYYHYGKGRARTVAKHGIRPKLRQLIPAALVAGLAVCLLLAMISPWFLLVPAGYGLALMVISLWQAARHKSASGRYAGPALAAMHLSWGAGFLWQTLSGRRAR